jgi:hypothetical protein
MNFQEVDEYLHKLHYTEHYTELDVTLREKIAFTANEMLLSYFDSEYITTKVVALQTLYMIEGEAEEFAKFKRHGVKSMGVSGMSFSFDSSTISPDVIALIQKMGGKGTTGKAMLGRLV